MFKKIDRNKLIFFGGLIGFYLVIQVLQLMGIVTSFLSTILSMGTVLAIVSLGLNLIYGFNGQFSLGQWGFYAIGAYSAADITYRWSNNQDTSALLVLLFSVILVGGAIMILYRTLSRLRGLDALSAFVIYLLATFGFVFLSIKLGGLLTPAMNSALGALPEWLSFTIVYILAVLIAGLVAAEISFLFGLPVLTLGSDYFGIATLGFSIIVKVLLDNSDTLLGFEEMKGARGMIGIPKVDDWGWFAVFAFFMIVVVVTRNLLHSSFGRAIISVREDEIAAKAMGIDVGFYKTLTFVIGSLFAGLAGGLYAHVNAFLHPDTFNFIRSFDPLIVVVLGGLGSMTGTIFASYAYLLVVEWLLRQILPPGFENWRFVVFPVILLIMMLLKPNGLFGNFEMPFLRQLLPPLKKKPAAEAAAAPQEAAQ
ncbi:MAG: branched-chain amino acid ABC transporter permease [Anaerolineaceae bacterium]|nr:branched-chain amino acid ABC transporter permease [Anaerolineaceae bacterium]